MLTRCACRSAGWPSASTKFPLTRASSIRSSFRWYTKRSVSRSDQACVTDKRSNWLRISNNRSYCSRNRSSILPSLYLNQSMSDHPVGRREHTVRAQFQSIANTCESKTWGRPALREHFPPHPRSCRPLMYFQFSSVVLEERLLPKPRTNKSTIS